MKKAYIQGSISEEVDLSEAFLQLVYELKLNESEMLETFVKQGNMTIDSFLTFCQLNELKIVLDFEADVDSFQVYYTPLRNLETTSNKIAPETAVIESNGNILEEDPF
jgi:hypothetical protein